MPRFFADLLAQFRGIWSRLDGAQRLTMSAVVAGVLVGLGALVWFASRPDYQVAFQSEDARALSDAARALSRAGIGFRRDGSALAVERDALPLARSALLEAGVSAGEEREDFSVLTQLTLDRETRRDMLDAKNRRRAEHAVRQISGVADVTVTSSLPERSPYTSRDRELQPRASVILRLRPGTPFHRTAASAVDAVAAALGLAPDQVVVRNSLTKEKYQIDPGSGAEVDSSEFFAQQRSRSAELTERAQALLDGLYPNQTRVQVTVDLDPSWEVRNEKIVPEEPIVVQDRTTKFDTSDRGAVPPPAGDPSLAAPASGAADAGMKVRKDQTKEKTYEPFAGTANKGKLAPDVRKLSIALVVDEKLNLAADKLEAVKALVKQAVGFSTERDGDGFAVHVEKMPEAPAEVASAGPGLLELAAEYGPTAAQVLAVVVVVLFLRGLLRRAAAQPQAPAAAAAAAAPPEEEESLPQEEGIKRMRREIERAISEDTAAVSRLLEAWLSEAEA
jgi:flagellar M-ring protein FliF